MSTPTLYSDEYLDIFDDHMVFKNYYFLKFGQKRVNFADVGEFKEVRLTYFNGMSRHTNNWYKPRWPFDWKVKARREAFLIKPKGQWLGIGFSAAQPREVALLIHKKIHQA